MLRATEPGAQWGRNVAETELLRPHGEENPDAHGGARTPVPRDPTAEHLHSGRLHVRCSEAVCTQPGSPSFLNVSPSLPCVRRSSVTYEKLRGQDNSLSREELVQVD